MKNLFLILCLICTSCANPTVINVIGPNDNKLNCEELSAEIGIANQYANEAQEAKKDNRINVDSLFWGVLLPALSQKTPYL